MSEPTMRAGFSRVDITPPLGTPLGGWGISSERLSEVNNDPLYVRALSVSHEREEALILTLDLCFVSREDADRFKGVLGRELGLLSRQILINASHTHAGPAVGTYVDLYYAPPLRDYLATIEAAVVQAAGDARAGRKEVTLRAGMGKTTIPLNRRGPRGGEIANAPNPDGPILDSLPVCLFEDEGGKPVALLFAASTHPVCVPGRLVSADYPGAATARLDEHFGTACSMFLQGAGGDSRPRVLGEGRESWNHACGPDEAQQTGQTLADDVLRTIGGELPAVQPAVRSALIGTRWPLQDNLTRQHYEEIAGEATDGQELSMRQRWAARQIKRLDQGALPTSLELLMQGLTMGEGVRLIALEGELVCEHGRAIEGHYPDGVTFALGYSNGEGLYLVTSAQLDEGGYEPGSYWEYGHPSALAKGTEEVIAGGLKEVGRLGTV